MTAWINGFLGIALTLGLGSRMLELDAPALLRVLVANFFVSLLAPLAILKLEGTPWIRQKIMTRSLVTWPIFVSLYVGANLVLSPELRVWTTFRVLIFPLILASGLSIVAFGPIQDFFVRRRQLRARRAKA